MAYVTLSDGSVIVYYPELVCRVYGDVLTILNRDTEAALFQHSIVGSIADDKNLQSAIQDFLREYAR